jgi:hypothetical protein
MVMLMKVACGGVLLLALSLSGAGYASARPRGRAAATATPAQVQQLNLAVGAVADARRHWGTRGGFYYERLTHGRYPLATIWGMVGVFEALDGVAAARPTAANRAAVNRIAAQAERYWDPARRGYAPYPGDGGGEVIWFDDNGWLGLAFDNAYAVTGNRRWLTDARRALSFIANRGWDRRHGGIWWNTAHPFHAGDSLSSATLLATLIYRQTHDPSIGSLARQFMGWADTGGFSAPDGLYRRTDTDPGIIDYIQGPLIYAHRVMCDVTRQGSLCDQAERLADTALDRFGSAPGQGPQYDAVYLQWMLALYREDRDARWYDLALTDSSRAQQARDRHGLYLNAWGGGPLAPSVDPPGMLRVQGSTASLFAWLADTPPPR